MPNRRLDLALEQMDSGDWRDFERFAAEFLAVEFPSLRTTASASGDKGQDGEIYYPGEEVYVAVQYSVSRDWKSKIKKTVARIAETKPKTRSLIYATNQLIGADADDLITSLRRDNKLLLDIRDRSWFVDRESSHPQREIASQELARRYVDPLLEERGVRKKVAPVLKREEARVAVLHLALDQQDKAGEKNITRSCFESLVLSTLHDTNTGKRKSRDSILESVRDLLPSGHDQQVEALVDGAINRLSKRGGPIKRYGKTREYHLSNQEHERVRTRVTAFILEENSLIDGMIDIARTTVPGLQIPEDYSDLGEYLKYCLDTVLLAKGEAFASTVTTGEPHQLDAGEAFRVLSEPTIPINPMLDAKQATSIILEVLERPSDALNNHLRRLADAYTLYAFLRQTPDVQRVLLTVFSQGEIWLDTTVILPLLAETLLSNPTERHYTTMLRAALDADLKLYVTNGVIEELEGHLRVCLAFARIGSGEWNSRVPFVYANYALSGRPRSGFSSWSENFMGNSLPHDDIAEYLESHHSITTRDLPEADSADLNLRAAVQEIWHETHERRRNSRNEQTTDMSTRLRLVEHDVENTVGVIQLRSQTPVGPMGYQHWLLTLDRVALDLRRKLRDATGINIQSPAISPDFMAQYLRLGPLRKAVDDKRWISLPIVTDISRYNFLPHELITKADTLREEIAGKEEHVVQRRVRDTLNEMKQQHGPEALGGIPAVEERMRSQLRRQQE